MILLYATNRTAFGADSFCSVTWEGSEMFHPVNQVHRHIHLHIQPSAMTLWPDVRKSLNQLLWQDGVEEVEWPFSKSLWGIRTEKKYTETPQRGVSWVIVSMWKLNRVCSCLWMWMCCVLGPYFSTQQTGREQQCLWVSEGQPVMS